jgi:hypothetical protein
VLPPFLLQVAQQADELLSCVQLTEAAGARSGSYSGGIPGDRSVMFSHSHKPLHLLLRVFVCR